MRSEALYTDPNLETFNQNLGIWMEPEPFTEEEIFEEQARQRQIIKEVREKLGR